MFSLIKSFDPNKILGLQNLGLVISLYIYKLGLRLNFAKLKLRYDLVTV